MSRHIWSILTMTAQKLNNELWKSNMNTRLLWAMTSLNLKGIKRSKKWFHQSWIWQLRGLKIIAFFLAFVFCVKFVNGLSLLFKSCALWLHVEKSFLLIWHPSEIFRFLRAKLTFHTNQLAKMRPKLQRKLKMKQLNCSSWVVAY